MRYGCPYHRTPEEHDSTCYWCKMADQVNYERNLKPVRNITDKSKEQK